MRAAVCSGLGNGLRVYMLPQTGANTVTCGLWIRQGSMDETPETNGLSHLLEHVLCRSAHTSAGATSHQLAALGARWNATTGRDLTGYHLTVLPEHLAPALSLLASIPSADPTAEALERERPAVRQEHAGHLRSTERIHDLMALSLWGTQGVGLPVLGDERVICGATVANLRAMQLRAYRPEKTALVVVGKVAELQVMALASACLEQWAPSDARPSATCLGPGASGSRMEWLDTPGELITLLVGWRLPLEVNPRQAEVEMLARLLGASTHGRLVRELREKRSLAYHVGAHALAFRNEGYLAAVVKCHRDHVKVALEIILAQAQDLAIRPTLSEEFTNAWRLFLTDRLFEWEDPVVQLRQVARHAAMGCVWDRRVYLKQLEQLAPESVQRAAQQILVPTNMGLAGAGRGNGDELRRVAEACG